MISLNITDMKNKKANLEIAVERAERDIERMAAPQVIRSKVLAVLKIAQQAFPLIERKTLVTGI